MLPADANTAAGTQSAGLLSVACTSPGSCVAVGGYKSTNGGDELAMVVTESGGIWARPQTLSLPPFYNTTAGGQYAELESVTCTNLGNCVGVGLYSDTNGSNDDQAMVATETGGAWGAASEITLPAGASTTAGGQFAQLQSVTCTSPGNCVAVGSYVPASTNPALNDQAMVVAESGGIWGTAQQLTLPSNYETNGTLQTAYLSTVTCTSPGNCVAAGAYNDMSDDPEGMVVTEASGVWGQASELVLPTNALPVAQINSAALTAVTCTGAGDCVAVGYYPDTTGSVQPMVSTEAGGVWDRASELTLPPDAITTAGAQSAGMNSVTCTSPGDCVAAGSYVDTNGSTDRLAMAASESGGAWGPASTVSLPPFNNTTAGGQDASLDSVTCTSLGNCVAAGTYTDTNGSGDKQAMVVSSVPTLAVSTSSLPSGVVGSAYSAQLAATGGAGGYTWSVASGALPAGLSLNATTGAISGTPIASGTFAFTIAVSDPGPPNQQASIALSITVAAPASGGSIVGTGSPGIATVKIKRRTVFVTVSCGGTPSQTCTGTLMLTTLEHFTAHRLTAISAKKAKKTTRTVMLGKATYTLTAGAPKTLAITLNGTGKKLLVTYHKLPAKLTLTPTESTTAVAAKTVTITQHKVKTRHHQSTERRRRRLSNEHHAGDAGSSPVAGVQRQPP